MKFKCKDVPMMRKLLAIRAAFPNGYKSDEFDISWYFEPEECEVSCWFKCMGIMYHASLMYNEDKYLLCNLKFESEADALADELLDRYLQVGTIFRSSPMVDYTYVEIEGREYTIEADKVALLMLLPDGTRYKIDKVFHVISVLEG